MFPKTFETFDVIQVLAPKYCLYVELQVCDQLYRFYEEIVEMLKYTTSLY